MNLIRRNIFCFIAAIVSICSTISCFALAFADAASVLSGISLVEVAVVAASLLVAVFACARLMVVRGKCRQLAQSISQMTVAEKFEPVTTSDAGLWNLASSVNKMVEKSRGSVATASLKSREMEIRMKVAIAERQHAESIIYSISDAVLVTDSFDELVLANESAAKTFEFDLANVERAPVAKILNDPRLITMIREMRQSTSKSERRVVEHSVKSNGLARTYKVTLSCFADRANPGATEAARPAGVVAVLHDVTKEKELASMKNDFVSHVSHELRTPLASIKAYVEMLIDGEAESERTKTEFYEVIQNEANRLGRLIDDILNISRIESGLVKVNRQPQSLAVIIKEAVEVITPQATQKGIRIVEGATPVFYQTPADRDMLYQAVLNLLSNAVKYTPKGGSIEVVTAVDETKKIILTRVNDTGVGIPAKDLPFVFEKFYRAEANNRVAKGTGLGLALVKQIVETVHGGKMFVESTVGKGSSFGFELKLAD